MSRDRETISSILHRDSSKSHLKEVSNQIWVPLHYRAGGRWKNLEVPLVIEGHSKKEGLFVIILNNPGVNEIF